MNCPKSKSDLKRPNDEGITKHVGDEHARDAFEAIKTAYELLLDPKKRDRQILVHTGVSSTSPKKEKKTKRASAPHIFLSPQVIEGARERAKKERKFKLDKGLDPETLPSEEECFDREVLKTFAQNEMKRRDVEDHNRVQAQREREHEEVATKKVDDEKKFEEQWNQDGRRGDRVDFWQQYTHNTRDPNETPSNTRVSDVHSIMRVAQESSFLTRARYPLTPSRRRRRRVVRRFQDDDERAGGQKRLRTAKQFKQQTHDVKKKKHGEADMEGWKKEWK